MRELLVLWMLAVLGFMQPEHRPHAVLSAQETPQEEDARRRELAESIIDAAFDPQTRPVFGGAYGRSRSAALLALQFWSEGGLRRDIQLGIDREAQAKRGINDFGNSWGLGQIHLGKRVVRREDGSTYVDSLRTTEEGWTGRELLSDPSKCARATLALLRRSVGACRALPLEERLAAYARGSCSSPQGQRISTYRMIALKHYWRKAWIYHPQQSDQELLAHWGQEQAPLAQGD